MKTNSLFFLLFLLFTVDSTFSQIAPSKYWVRFKDRSGTPYSTASPAAYLSQRAIDRRTTQGIAVIQNDLPVNPSYIAGVQAVGVTLINRSKWFNSIIVYTTDTNKINAIEALPYVLSVKPVARMKKKKTDDAVDDKFTKEFLYTGKQTQGNTTHAPNAYDYGQGLNQISMIGGDCLHNKGFHGEGMVISILDAGFYVADTLAAFDSLRSNNQILGTWDFVANEASVYEDYVHGMMCLSTMAANLPGQFVGTAPKAKYWLLRSEEAASEYVIEEHNWVSAAEFADSVGTDVITVSLGYTTFQDSPNPWDHTYADMNGNTCVISIAADIAVSKGMIVLAAAGNEGSNPWHFISAPSDADSVIAVGAVDGNKVYAPFSSKGPSSDGQVKPTIAAKGSGSTIANTDGTITTGSGTSFATPIAAGAVACLWQAHPNKTNMEIFDAIIQSADRFSSPDTLTGYGIPNFCTADSILSGIDKILTVKRVISVYPNPFTNRVTISFYAEKDGETEINLYDISGRLIMKQINNNRANKINIVTLFTPEILAKGIYILNIKNKDTSQSLKIVKE